MFAKLTLSKCRDGGAVVVELVQTLKNFENEAQTEQNRKEKPVAE